MGTRIQAVPLLPRCSKGIPPMSAIAPASLKLPAVAPTASQAPSAPTAEVASTTSSPGLSRKPLQVQDGFSADAGPVSKRNLVQLPSETSEASGVGGPKEAKGTEELSKLISQLIEALKSFQQQNGAQPGGEADGGAGGPSAAGGCGAGGAGGPSAGGAAGGPSAAGPSEGAQGGGFADIIQQLTDVVEAFTKLTQGLQGLGQLGGQAGGAAAGAPAVQDLAVPTL
ncbi:uncharacterized protein STAUR_8236 [Stigmatella aurantiaca DW4/3-1]|nr:uncharacterized protein STAUR_8236 [Stigmatella aurantiaca DW4/3-1]